MEGREMENKIVHNYVELMEFIHKLAGVL